MALFENWDNYTDALETSRNAVGTLQEQQDIYMESTQALLKRLTAAQEDLYDSLLKPEDIEGVVSVFINLTKAATNFVDTIGGGKAVLSGLGALASQIFARQIANSIATSITNMRGLTENSRKLAAQLEIINQFRGININDESTQRLINMKEQILQYSAVLTTEQQNEANEIIRATNEIQNQTAAWNERRQAAEEYYRQQTGQEITITRGLSTESQREISEQLRQLAAEWRNVNGEVERFTALRDRAGRAQVNAEIEGNNQQLEEARRLYGEVEREINGYIAALENLTEADRLSERERARVNVIIYEYVRAVRQAEEANRNLATDNAVRNASENVARVFEEITSRITQGAREAARVLNQEIGGETDRLRNSADLLRQSFSDMTSGANLQLTLNQFTQMISTIGQLSFAFNSFANLFEKWQDDSTSFGEKLTTTFMVVGTSLPMLITSYQRFNELLGTTNVLTQYRNLLQQQAYAIDVQNLATQIASNTALGLNAETIRRVVTSLQQRIAAERLDIATMTEAQGVEALSNILEERGIELDTARIELIWQRIVAENAATRTTSRLTLATRAFNATLAANPIISVVMALSTLVFAVNAVTGAMEKARQRNIEFIEQERDKSKAVVEENDKVKELYNTYLSFYSVYSQTGENKDELEDATEALCQALNIEIDTLDLLADRYDTVNEKILAFMKIKNKEAMESAEVGQTQAGLALTQQLTTPRGTTGKSTISLSGGRSGLNRYDQEISKYFVDRLEDIDDLIVQGYSDSFGQIKHDTGHIEEFGKFASINILGDIDYEQLIEIRNALQETVDFLTVEFKDNSTVLVKSKLYQNIVKILDETKENAEAYVQFEESIRDSLIESASIITQEEGSFDISELDSTEKFAQYRKEYIEALKKAYSDKGLEHSDDEIEKIAEEYYFNRIDSLSKQERDYQLEKEMHERFQNSKEEIDNFIKELRENDEIELAIKVSPQGGETIEEFRDRLTEEYAYYYNNSAQEIQTALNSMAQDKKTQKELKEENELLDNLERKYAEYFTTLERGSHEYLATLREIKEHEETLAMKGLQATKRRQTREYEEAREILQIYEDYAKNGNINPIDIPGFEEALEKVEDSLERLAETDYQIHLQITADLETDVEDAFGLADEFEDLREIINDDLLYTLEEAQDLINRGYGALFENSSEYIQQITDDTKTIGEAMIQVNQETLDSFIDSRQAELNADKEAKIAQLELQKVLIDAQRTALKDKIEALKAAVSAESDIEAAEAMQRATLAEAEYQAATERLNAEITNESDAANEKQDINKTLYDTLGGMYEQNSANYQQSEIDATTVQQREIDTRLRNVQLLSAAYSALGAVIKAAMSGESLGEVSVGSASGGGGLMRSKSAEMVTNKTTPNKLTAEDFGDYIKDLYNNNREEYNATTSKLLAEAESLLAQKDAEYGARDLAIAALNSVDTNLDKTQEFAKPGGRKSGGKSKDGKDPDLMDYLEDETDRYHDVNLELERLSTNLDILTKQQEKLYGKNLVENLNKQLAILEKQKKVYQEKLNIAKQEMAEVRSSLEKQGVTFYSNDYINNYELAMKAKLNYVNTVIDQYNGMSAEEQEVFKDTVEAAKKDYETFKSEIERYDELISSFMPDIEEEIQNATNEEIAIKIDKFTMEVELRLDMAEAERDFNEFRRKVIDEIKDDGTAESILGNAQAKLRDVASYFRLDPEVVEEYGKLFNTENKEDNIISDRTSKRIESKKKEIEALESEIQGLEEEFESLYSSGRIKEWTKNDQLSALTKQATNLRVELRMLEDSAQESVSSASNSLADTIIGPIQKLTDQVNSTMDEIDAIAETGWSEVYGDDKATAMKHLENYYKELMQQLEDITDLVDEIKESYLDMIDVTVDAFDKQVDRYDYIKDLLDHDMNVIGLVYGDKAYAQMAGYYEKIEQNNNKELDFLKKRVAYAEEMMKQETDPKAKEKWEEEWMDALDKLNEKVEDSIQNIIDKYHNAINKTFQDLNNKVTGGLGLDYVSDEWDLINKNADQYLDTINSLYGMQELENKYLDAINNTDNLSSQKKLNDLMNEQLSMLRDKDKLTQYDVDRANMLYEIALKEIALEEAQQNKSQMRLRRDSQGNYSYQFVADDEEIGKAQDDLLLAQRDLYNFDKEKYKENLNEIYEYYVEFQEKYAQIMADMSLTDEQKQERTKLLTEQYGQLINGLVEQNETIKQNLYESTFIALEGLYAADAESFTAMTGKEIEEFRNLTEMGKDLIISGLIPQWESGVQHMADVFAGNGGFIPTCKDAFEELDQATQDYKDSLDDLESAAGVNFDSIADGYDRNIELAEDLLEKNDDLIDKYREQIDAIRDVIDKLDDLMTQYESVRTQAIAATTEAYKYLQAQKEIAAEMANLAVSSTDYESGPSGVSGWSGASQPNIVVPSASPSSGGSSSGGTSNKTSTSTSSATTKTPTYKAMIKVSDKVYTYGNYGNSAYIYASSLTSKDKGKDIQTSKVSEIIPDEKTGKEKKVILYKWLNTNLGLISNKLPTALNWVAQYKSGGYTGEWNSDEGKMAVLHEKELILNKNDTANILSAVNLVRDMAGLLNNINDSFLSRMSSMSLNSAPTINSISMDPGTLEQNVKIEATFPGVQNSKEIEDALNNLVNVASQRAYKTKR